MTQDIHDCQVRQTQDHTTVATLMWITETTLLVSYVNCAPQSILSVQHNMKDCVRAIVAIA